MGCSATICIALDKVIAIFGELVKPRGFRALLREQSEVFGQEFSRGPEIGLERTEGGERRSQPPVDAADQKPVLGKPPQYLEHD